MNMETSDIVQPKKRRVHHYNNEILANAMCAVNDGRMNLSEASVHFKIPRTTLAKKVKLGETTIKNPGPKPRTCVATTLKKNDKREEVELQVQDQDIIISNSCLNSEIVKSDQKRTITEMELGDTVKKEMEWCIVCMHDSDVSSTPEHVSTYKELLGKNVDDGVHPKFCSKCSTFLQDVQNFKMTCLNSFSRLFESVFAEPLKYEETVLQVEDNVSEEVNEDNDFEIEVHEDKLTKIEINDESKQIRKRKVATPKKKVIAPQNKITTLQLETDYCNFCDITVSSWMPHILDQHMTVLDQTYSNCNICNTKILAKTTLKHFNIHNNRFGEPKACGTCGKQFLEVHRYKQHQKTHEKFECDLCGRKTISKGRIKRHILTKHLSVKCCYHCKEFFYDVETYTAHMAWEKTVRPNISQICAICGFEAANKISLSHHSIRQHTEPVSCDKCGKSFKSRLALKEHNKQNHEELRFTCEYCGKKFVRPRPLKFHIESVHKPRYVECDLCGKSLRPSALRTHTRITHSNVYKFPCNICGRAFKVAPLLKKHYFSHVKKRPFNCHLCTDTGYYMTDYLKKHYQRIHGVEYTTQEVREVMREVTLNEIAAQVQVNGI